MVRVVVKFSGEEDEASTLKTSSLRLTDKETAFCCVRLFISVLAIIRARVIESDEMLEQKHPTKEVISEDFRQMVD